jgi:histone H3/H4
METTHRPAIVRLARVAGVKSVSEDAIGAMRNIVTNHMVELLKVVRVVNSETTTKTIMVDDVYTAFDILGIRVARSGK